LNSSFFLEPYSPNVWKYWMAFNDYQHEKAGDPFVGAKLGNLFLSQGFKDIKTEVKTWMFDSSEPGKRKTAIEYWKELLLSAADQLIEAGVVDSDLVRKMREELDAVSVSPNAVFFYSFIQASAHC
ncbi:MAG: SAM-dependent methyltransferase, partial [Pseudobdellovibrionaceae bacterium]